MRKRRFLTRDPPSSILDGLYGNLRIARFKLAEGARFELAVHEVDAGFQDRWFQPLTHPSDKNFNYLAGLLAGCESSCLPFKLPFSRLGMN